MEWKIKDETGRLDVFLAKKIDLTRSKIQKLIKEEKILLNHNKTSSNYQVKKDDIITLMDDELSKKELEPLDLKVEIVFEDDNLLIVNKPSGLVVHPAPGHQGDTLVNALITHFKLSHQDSLRPGIVHRLDKDTSGLMLVAKNDKTHDLLTDMLKKKEVKRYYIALVDGVIPNQSGTIDAPIGRDPKNRLKMAVTSKNSKEAITNFKVIKRFKNHTLIECELKTGRTHQIRVHLAYIGHPVTNDPLYGKNKHTTSFGQMLHSYKIVLEEPITKEKLAFEKDVPEEFKQLLATCTKEENEV